MPHGAAAAAAPRRGARYGWWIVAASFAGVMVSFGPLVVFPFGLFLKALASEFGWTRAQVSLAFSLAALAVAAASPFLGRAADRYGARRVILICAPAFGLLFASLNWLTPSLAHLYAVFLAIGVVGNGGTQLTYARIVSGWFDRRRGLALALVMCGAGTGAMLAPLAAEILIRGAGWRNAYLVLGLTAVTLATPLALLVLKEPPGAAVEPRAAVHKGAGAVLRSRTAISLLGAFFLLSLGANGCVAHLPALLTDRGVSTRAAALAAALLGSSSLAGRLLTGILLDRFFAPRVGFILIAGSIAGMALVVVGPVWTAVAAAALIGLAMGAEADLMPYLVGRYFGLRRFGEMYGYSFSVYAIAGAAGPFLMGWVFDVTGSYRTAVLLLAAATAIASIVILRLPRYAESEN